MEHGSEKPGILIVDDNPEIREVLRILLGGEGFEIHEAKNGSLALEKVQSREFDLIILDIMMPGMNGYQTCMEIRKNSNAPILFLSAKTQEGDKMLGFSSGGDDYLAKPFSYNELVSRAKAMIRRYQVYQGKDGRNAQGQAGTGYPAGTEEIADSIIRIFDIEINETRSCVSRGGHVIDLTDTEYAVLHLLAKNRHQIFSAEHLYESVWGEPYYYGANNTVMVHIRNLRRKIEDDPKNPTVIRTVWGRGYRCD
ncbi:DNA-binding response regulator [Lachnoclostridium sp. An169]|uniref:response regulator transcription factor n=1 Tax=Lachnoclostridium sp. An169 TaxID=1965569 RepID=UPI000B3A2978|nr:response regulator transcription factor [Lachnoclostridium sp. An169]OUP81154.1 DNA-binding response regulator [Lachnoclostridium sp. An169]HJA68185.1 response regulator transcription factor [Candidatus Mediterraneibacter cottocaccae]